VISRRCRELESCEAKSNKDDGQETVVLRRRKEEPEESDQTSGGYMPLLKSSTELD